MGNGLPLLPEANNWGKGQKKEIIFFNLTLGNQRENFLTGEDVS